MTSYTIIISFIIFGVSKIYAFLNSGAERSSILHVKVENIDHYFPKVTWSPINNEGRAMDNETLKNIQHDYLNAWYVKHLAYKDNVYDGIDDYYTQHARENIYSIIDKNTSDNITVESTTLAHHLTLDFFSEDGQLATLTDRDVIEYKQVYNSNHLLLEATDISTYKFIMLLEDGFWRIRHFIKETVDNYNMEIKTQIPLESIIKGINYYPKDSPWDMFGKKFNSEIIDKDFELIASIGLNTIRIFVPYASFGKADVDSEKLNQLSRVMDIAEKYNLKVMITLFDFYGDYSISDWTLTHRHAEVIVSHLKNHNALLAWDIKNEPNLDFESRGKAHVLGWLKHTINLVKSIDNDHPVTIGWSNAESAKILQDKVDFVTFHYYEHIDNLENVYNDLKKHIKKSIVISEFGTSSYGGIWNMFRGSEKKQEAYYKKAQETFIKHNIPYMSWTLYDFEKIPQRVVGIKPWRKAPQKHFGFIDKKGRKKLSFKYIAL